MNFVATEVPTLSSLDRRPLAGNGIGLRAPHYHHFLHDEVAIDWLEVHSENYFAQGGWDRQVLTLLAERYPLSFHGVGLSLGAAHGLSETHLLRLKQLVEDFQPALVSEHLSWGSIPGRHLNDLLPLVLNDAALDLMCERLDHVQNVLRRPILIENVSSYLRFREDSMSEAEFLYRLSQRSGCAILLDINNLYVNQCNHGEDARTAIDVLSQLPLGRIAEVHLAGHSVHDDVVIDDHGSTVKEAVWELYRYLCQRVDDDIPTMIEWDTALPPLSVLLNEAHLIQLNREASRV